MQNKLPILIVLQVGCIAFFLMAALACKSVQPSTKTVRAPQSECQSGDYLYIGKHASEDDARKVAQSHGMNEVCSSEQNNGVYFAK